MKIVNLPWSWGSKISEQLLWDRLQSTKHLLAGIALDVGCGKKPYWELLGADVEQWIGIDVARTPSRRSAANVLGSVLDLPFGGGTFDTILSTQVLEHVPRPECLLREACRVLRSGGHLLLTTPQTGPLHEEPRDYFRFTCHGLRFLAQQSGFEVLEIAPLGGAIATVGQMIIWHLNWVRRIPLIGKTVSKWVNAGLAWLALQLDRLSPMYGRGATKDTLNWLLVARKP